MEKSDGRLYEAGLYWVKGKLLLTQENQKPKGKRGRFKVQGSKFKATNPQSPTPTPQAEAEECFHHALDIARRQEAKSLELRAAISLSRLWQKQGKKEEAQLLLTEIYDWFTEGYDTADLREAKALLEALS